MIIAIAGLRGVGKTALATAIGTRLDAHVLNLATVRAAYFGQSPEDLDEASDDAHSFMREFVDWTSRDATVVLDHAPTAPPSMTLLPRSRGPSPTSPRY